MSNITRIGIVPRHTAALSTFCTGDALDRLLKRAVAAYAAEHGHQIAIIALERDDHQVASIESVGGVGVKGGSSSERLSLAGEQTWASTKEEFTG